MESNRFVASYLKWPKSAWYVLVFETEFEDTFDAVSVMHLSDPDIRRWSKDQLVSVSSDWIASTYPEATTDEVMELCACLAEIASVYKLTPASAEMSGPLVEPSAFQVSDFPISHAVDDVPAADSFLGEFDPPPGI